MGTITSIEFNKALQNVQNIKIHKFINRIFHISCTVDNVQSLARLVFLGMSYGRYHLRIFGSLCRRSYFHLPSITFIRNLIWLLTRSCQTKKIYVVGNWNGNPFWTGWLGRRRRRSVTDILTRIYPRAYIPNTTFGGDINYNV